MTLQLQSRDNAKIAGYHESKRVQRSRLAFVTIANKSNFVTENRERVVTDTDQRAHWKLHIFSQRTAQCGGAPGLVKQENDR